MSEKPEVLFVEDDPAVITTFTAGLEAEGYPVEGVSSTSEALKRLANHSYPIVVTDIYLDERTGLDVLRAARENNPECLASSPARARWRPSWRRPSAARSSTWPSRSI
jgi:CheY-like chemotaxis protein